MTNQIDGMAQVLYISIRIKALFSTALFAKRALCSFRPLFSAALFVKRAERSFRRSFHERRKTKSTIPSRHLASWRWLWKTSKGLASHEPIARNHPRPQLGARPGAVGKPLFWAFTRNCRMFQQRPTDHRRNLPRREASKVQSFRRPEWREGLPSRDKSARCLVTTQQD